MKTYLIHHTPKSPAQDTWTVSFSLPYIANAYVRTGDGIWYVKTWLSAEQIKKRLAILFDSSDELRVHELGRNDATLNSRLHWLDGRLEDEETSDLLNAPRVMWQALQTAAQSFAFARAAPAAAMAASSGNSRAA